MSSDDLQSLIQETLDACRVFKSGVDPDPQRVYNAMVALLRHPMPETELITVITILPDTISSVCNHLLEYCANLAQRPSNDLLAVLHQYSSRVPFSSNPLPALCDARPDSPTTQVICCVCLAGQCLLQRRKWPYLATVVHRLADLAPVSEVCVAIGIALQACPWLVVDRHLHYAMALSFALPALYAAISVRICQHVYGQGCADCANVLVGIAEARLHSPYAVLAPLLCRSVTRTLQFATDRDRENIVAQTHDFVSDHFVMFAGFRSAPMDAAFADKLSPIRALLSRYFLTCVLVIASSLTSDPASITVATSCLSLLEFARVRFSGYARLFLLLVNEGLRPDSGIADRYIDDFLPSASPNWNPILVRHQNFFALSILQAWVVRCSQDRFTSKLFPYITSFFHVRDASCSHKAHVIFCSRFALDSVAMRDMAPRYAEIMLETYPTIITSASLRHAFVAVTRSLPEDDPMLLYIFNLLLLRTQELITAGDRSIYAPAVACSASCLQNLHATFIDQGLHLFDAVLDAAGPQQRLDVLSVLQSSMSGAIADVTIKDRTVRWYLQTLARLDIRSSDVLNRIRSMSRPDKPPQLVNV